jgi:glycosyltransferase involved in cell wall biosynthesis
MEPPVTAALTTIIIPTYNHAAHLRDAVDSALAQTAPVEVIVVDDGSTDATPAVLASYGELIRPFRIEHAGPSAARNLGLEKARGVFVMFLDADDVIAPGKVARQLTEMRPEIGWVLCDVRIEDEARARAVRASDQYGYRGRQLNGWIKPQLDEGNFIPIMSPLVRRCHLTSIRFSDAAVPEDWHFWRGVASVARVAYLPEVLATYRHRRTGRSRIPKAARATVPNIEAPLRLNLGCGRFPIPGMVNLDKRTGWRFEDGLDFADHSVAGITISHSLYLLPEERWFAAFSEFARVLEDGE